jgi:hypothetical protein
LRASTSHLCPAGEVDDGQLAVGVAQEADGLPGGVEGLAEDLPVVVDVGHGAIVEGGDPAVGLADKPARQRR